MDAYRYQQRGESEVHHSLNADLAFGLVPDRFFLDLGGSRSQAIVDPEGTIPFDNLAITTNRIDRDDFYAGPSFRVPVGDNVLVRGDLRRTWVRYADALPALAALGDYEADESGLSVDNYRKGTGVSWALRYADRSVDYGTALTPFEYRQAYAEIGFWVNEAVRLFLVGGKESPWNEPLESGLTDSFWETGMVRELGERFRAEFAVGDRSFGSSARAELDYDFGRGKTTLTYNETPTTSANDRFDRGGLLALGEPNDYLFRAGSAERYISKRLQWRLNLDWERYEFAFALFDESRDDRTRVDGAPLAGEQQSGLDLAASWRFGARVDLYLRAMRANREFADGEDSDLAAGAVGAGYKLGRRMHLALEIERREQTSASAAALNYRDELVSVVMAYTF
jgi:hypothetical protein